MGYALCIKVSDKYLCNLQLYSLFPLKRGCLSTESRWTLALRILPVESRPTIRDATESSDAPDSISDAKSSRVSSGICRMNFSDSIEAKDIRNRMNAGNDKVDVEKWICTTLTGHPDTQAHVVDKTATDPCILTHSSSDEIPLLCVSHSSAN